MIDINNFLKFLKLNKINFYTGVPDSVLKKLSLKIDNFTSNEHIISTNEGSAVAIGVGYYLSKKKLPAIYMQNSGLGNAINPLISITNKKVYSIPMLLIIGWRGAPGTTDEVQHLEKGKITKDLLRLLKIKTIELKNDNDFKKLKKLIALSKKDSVPVACLIKRNTLMYKNKKNQKKVSIYPKSLERAYVLEEILKNIKNNTDLISTTGFTSRELYQIRLNKKFQKGKDFYMVGGMGHSGMVALGNSYFKKNETICLDGDGAALMHLGSLSILGNFGKKNLKYILLNNSSHESVGGQRTIASKIDFRSLAKSFKFKRYFISSTKINFKKNLKKFLKYNGPSFFEIQIRNKSMDNLSRPKNLHRIKKLFLND
jgi:phosphonopyruvate decarboxylase